MFVRFIGLLLVLYVGSPAGADDVPPFPKQLPPIICTATVATPAEEKNRRVENPLACTTDPWEIVGDMIPKKEWPRLKTDVKKVNLILEFGGPSQLAESRVVDMKGKELSRDQLLKRFAKETPVLLSVSGEMPDAYFLQLTNPEALIVILGPRTDIPHPDYFLLRRIRLRRRKTMARSEPSVSSVKQDTDDSLAHSSEGVPTYQLLIHQYSLTTMLKKSGENPLD